MYVVLIGLFCAAERRRGGFWVEGIGEEMVGLDGEGVLEGVRAVLRAFHIFG